MDQCSAHEKRPVVVPVCATFHASYGVFILSLVFSEIMNDTMTYLMVRLKEGVNKKIIILMEFSIGIFCIALKRSLGLDTNSV